MLSINNTIGSKHPMHVIMFEKYNFQLGIFILIIYMSPYLALGENAYIRIHDNLDGEFVYRVLMARNGYSSIIPQIMNGVHNFASQLNIISLVFLFFKPYPAYLVNEFLVRLVAFIGMYLILKRHLLESEEQNLEIWGASFCFASLPFYSIYGLTIAGQPLLFYAFLNFLKRKQRISDFLIILIFSFYSSLILSGVFVIIALSILILYDISKTKRVNMVFLIGLVIFAITYTVAEYNLFYQMFLSEGFLSHRSEWNPSTWSYGNIGFIMKTISLFLYGQYHAVSLHTPILIICFLAFISVFGRKKLNQQEKYSQLLFILISFAFIISLFGGFFNWKGLVGLKEKIIFLKTFQADRFYFLFPLIWYISFALALQIISKIKIGKYIIPLFIAIQIIYLSMNNENLRGTMINFGKTIIYKMAGKKEFIGIRMDKLQSFKNFFSEDLFKEMKQFINKPQKDYRVISIGLHPSIAQYNGFYTLDGYHPNYSIEYKHKFRKIIEQELNKSPKLRDYYDYWGNRCYVFTAEENDRLINLELNIDALKSMGGEYIFSSKEILNYKDNNLELLKIFERDDSLWRIYLYKVI